MSLERKEMSFSRRRESQILHVSSSEAVAKKAAPRATAMQLMARRCSARCATRMPRGCHAVLEARSAAWSLLSEAVHLRGRGTSEHH